jgi:hypothetical protein
MQVMFSRLYHIESFVLNNQEFYELSNYNAVV